MNVIRLGPLLLNFDLLMLILSAVAAYLAIQTRLSKLNMEKVAVEKFFRAMILGFFTWKLSLIIFDPVSVIQYPMSLIYFDGGDPGMGLAWMLSLFYVWFRIRKERASIVINLDLASLGWIVGSSLYHLLRIAIDPSNIGFYALHVLLNGTLAFCLYAKNDKRFSQRQQIVWYWMWYSLGMASLYFILKGKSPWIIGFTKEQVSYFVIFLVGLTLNQTWEQKSSKEVR